MQHSAHAGYVRKHCCINEHHDALLNLGNTNALLNFVQRRPKSMSIFESETTALYSGSVVVVIYD
jgi:hypothetical protein